MNRKQRKRQARMLMSYLEYRVSGAARPEVLNRLASQANYKAAYEQYINDI